jgi:hypothetical protein
MAEYRSDRGEIVWGWDDGTVYVDLRDGVAQRSVTDDVALMEKLMPIIRAHFGAAPPPGDG